MSSVSCVCLTYNRPNLLEESIESFLRQDYAGEKELIIVNDFVHHNIIYNHPNVKVFNLKQRCSSIGEKRNLAASYATHKYVMPWDDDDIMLPHRISYSMDKIEKHNLDKYKLACCFVLSNNKMSNKISYHGGLYGTCVYNKHKPIHHPDMNSGEDAAFEQEYDNNRDTRVVSHCDREYMEDIYYIYRWGGEQYHVSWFKSEEVLDGVDKKIGDNYQSGDIVMQPHWNLDYVEECRKVKEKQ